jgi:hypothetical protein
MKLSGTIVNGQVHLDAPTELPNGTRVSLSPQADFDYPHPMAPYDREKEAALLRDRIAEMQAGVSGLTVDETFAALDAEWNRTLEVAEK